MFAQDMSAIDRNHPHTPFVPPAGRRMLLVPPSSKTINAYLPMELMREIFLYCIESNQMNSGQLASVCRYWRSVITTLSHLWSTLRVGTWTETEQVVTWLQRAYPKKLSLTPREITKAHPSLQCLLHSKVVLQAPGSGTSLLFPHFLKRMRLRSLVFKLQT